MGGEMTFERRDYDLGNGTTLTLIFDSEGLRMEVSDGDGAVVEGLATPDQLAEWLLVRDL